MSNLQDHWSSLSERIVTFLRERDDPKLWESAINLIFTDASYLACHATTRKAIVAEIGCCSHWLRPHQTRWTADGGFAWPSGYGGFGYSRTGAPEFDWSICAVWSPSASTWQPVEEAPRPSSRKDEPLTFTVVIPARTMQHRQAAIPTTWMPGSPVIPNRPCGEIYGFRLIKRQWQCTATSDGGRRHYEMAADNANRPAK